MAMSAFSQTGRISWKTGAWRIRDISVVDSGAMFEGIERRLDPVDMLQRQMPELELACDTLLLVRPGEVVEPEDEIEALVTELKWRYPNPVCHVVKCIGESTGTVELLKGSVEKCRPYAQAHPRSEWSWLLRCLIHGPSW